MYKDINFKGMNAYKVDYTYLPNQKILLHGGIRSFNQIIRFTDIPKKADSIGIWSYVEYQASDNTQFSLGVNFEDAKNYFDGYLLNFRVKHAFSPKLSLRSKLQYSDFSKTWFIEPMLTYQPSAFSAFYFGINELLDVDENIFSGFSENNRQFFIKFQYLF